MNKIRSFIAVDLNPQIIEIIGNLQRDLKQIDCDIKWSKPSNTHLTLKFLGDVPEEKIPEIIEGLNDVCQNQPSITTSLMELGSFPNIARPRVIWLGLKDDNNKGESPET